MDVAGPTRKADPARHWSQMIQEILLSVGMEGPFGINVLGGAENGQFCWIDDVDTSNIIYYTGKLLRDEIILEIQGQKVAGYTLHDLQEWLLLATNNNSPVLIKTVKTGLLPKDLREFLNTRFQKGSVDHDLQQTVRNNIYKRTVPCTTRLPRPGEVHGVDYKFLTLEEFTALEKNGSLLESGVFDGNYYGTPKPPKVPQNGESPFRRAGSMGNIVSGQHPSSEGKRRRNRSNIETNLSGNSAGEAHQVATLERKKSLERVHTTSGYQNQQVVAYWEKGVTTDTQYVNDNGPEVVRWMDRRLLKGLPKDEPSELPYGWERLDDTTYGTYYIDHINKKTQYEHPAAKTQPRNIVARDGLQDDQPDSPSSGLFSDKSSDRVLRKPTEPWTNGRSRSPPAYGLQKYVFTRNPAELRGDFVTTRLVKGRKGLGFTIIGGDDNNEEFLQIKTIIPHGPAFEDGKLQRSDVLVYINDHCVLGYSHQDIITLFQSIPVGDCVTLEVCRGYPLPFDPDDPNNEIITTVAVTLPSSEPSSATYLEQSQGRSSWADEGPSKSRYVMTTAKNSDDNNENLAAAAAYSSSSKLPSGVGSRPELHKVGITRGPLGFGFTIADSVYGQKVKQILDRPRCKILQEGDILVEINGVIVKDLKHAEVVQVLKSCPLGAEAIMLVQRGGIPSRSRAKKPANRSPTAGLDSRSQWNEDSTAFQKNSSYPGEGVSVPVNVTDVVATDNSGKLRDPSAVETKLNPVLSEKDGGQSETKVPQARDSAGKGKGQTDGGKADVNRSVEEGAPFRSAALPPPQGPGMRDLPDQRFSIQMEDDDMIQPADKTDAAGSYHATGGGGGGGRVPGYDYAGYGAPRRNVYTDFDDRSATSSYGTPPRRDLVNQMSFSEFDKRPQHVTRNHSRSKTPGPDMMRNRILHDGDPSYQHRPGQELRSKTPTQEMMSRMAKPISGTPDFIPASRYQTPSPLGRLQANDTVLNKPPDAMSMMNTAGFKDDSHHLPGPHLVPGSSGIPYGGVPVGAVAGTRPITPSLKQLNQQAAMKLSTSFENVEPVSGSSNPKDGWVDSPGGSVGSRSPMRSNLDGQDYELAVNLIRHESGFGFRIIGGTEEGSQVSVGHIVPGGAADVDGRLRPGDEIMYINNICVVGSSHHKVVQLMGQASNIGHVNIRVRRRLFLGTGEMSGMRGGQHYDVTLSRRDGEGFGFVIISSVTRSGSVIGKLVEGSPADRCSRLHVGDQILAVNHISITHLLHEQIVGLIKESGNTVTLTISGPDDTSSMSSITQRSASVPPASLGFQTQSESDMSRQSEYSPYHNSRIPHYSMEIPPRDVPFQHMPLNPHTSAPDLDLSDKFYSIELQRGSRGFGFSIRGGKEFNNMPLFILKIAEGGAAHIDGQLKVGDQIIEINGYNTNSMTHANAIDLIQSCNASIRVLVKRSGKPLPILSTSQLPYLPNGVAASQDASRLGDMRIPNNPPERSYLYGQGASQRYSSSYR